ncbi:MAG: DUF2167 domain-containing protein [Pseudomonadota bacterium]
MSRLSMGALPLLTALCWSPELPAAPAEEPSTAAADAAAAAVPVDAAAEAAPEWHPQTGRVELPGNIAVLDVPAGWLYLPPGDAEQLLTMWGNPPGSGSETLGMLVEADSGPDDPEGWVVIVTYDDSGHVTDADAGEIDYDDLLASMQEDTRAGNEYRRENGYSAVDLIGWAEPPRYDADEKKFYWAKELKFEGSEHNTLNYNVRVLGREGVLELNAVANMEQLPRIAAGMPAVIAMASFVDGQRYADYNEATDRLAGYGLAALVAGGVAAKTGLWAKLVALLIAGKKLLIPLAIGIALFIPGLYRRFIANRKKDGTVSDV